MRKYSHDSFEILQGLGDKYHNLAECALHLNERLDGSGFPQGLKGEEIPLIGRIACICDVFDAIISERPYKKAWPIDTSVEHIKSCSGTFFDPELVNLFLSMEDQIRKIIKTFGLN